MSASVLSLLLVTRAALLAAGHSEAQLRRRVSAGGDLMPVARGVYADRAAWQSASREGRHLLTVRGALLTGGDGLIVSHGSAAVATGLATLAVSIRAVHLTRPGAPCSRRRDGRVVHGGRLDGDEIEAVGDLQATSLGRTVADIARADGWLAGLVVADQGLRAGLSRDSLAAALDRQAGLPGTGSFTRLGQLADAGAENPGESLARALALEVTEALGLPPPETQFLIADGGRTAYADLRIGRVLIELDGRWKYARDRSFGDGSPPEEVVYAEKVREDWLRSLGFVVVRLTWADVYGSGRTAAIARLHDAVRRHSGLL